MIADAVNSATNSGAPESSASDTSSPEGVAVPAPPDPVTVLSNSISNSSKNSRAQLERNFENLKANRPANLLSGSEGDSAMAALAATGAKKISFHVFKILLLMAENGKSNECPHKLRQFKTGYF